MAYVIIAEFRTREGAAETFLARLRRHAELSLQEPGCHVFDICRDTEEPRSIVLYEVYSDAAAYAAHQAAPYYPLFREWAPPLLELKEDRLFWSRRVLTRS